MARKVFISYKYADVNVSRLQDSYYEEVNGELTWNIRLTRARDFVDKLQKKIGVDNINLGEKDGESLADFSDSDIETSLKRKIRQSSITIVLVSKGMKTSCNENDQWMPWEISYSLRTVPSGNYTKQMNAILGVVLPDETATYDWYYTSDTNCQCVTHHTDRLFKILKDNTFNVLEKKFRECDGSRIYINDQPSFFKTIKWDDFMNADNYNKYIELAIDIKNNKAAYDVHINLD